ncbi:Gfo/Idh/MocA family oxidoreductase [Fulvivirga sp.]|uniref:Gfo/Idh/MocA family protein n=1 Tax=Fulvivirga sp. TaxID=1931237 RepID=UPI0032EBE273
MRVLIVGIGSIAKKHIDALNEIIPKVEIFGLRNSQSSPKVEGVIDIYSWDQLPDNLDFIIISNPTSEHYQTLQNAIKCNLPLIIEKPPLANLDGAEELIRELELNNILNYVAFPLRFNPVIQWLKHNLPQKNIYELNAYCGSYLPDWRPNVNYRQVYSANKEMGGGVHLDLIHELDYVTWLLGSPVSSSSFLSKVSKLEIDSIDCAHYWLSYADKNASITLNYYRRDASREVAIVMEDGTWKANLLTNEVTDSSNNIIFKSEPSLKSMYYHQMRYFIDCVKKNKQPFNSFKESIETLRICLS